MDAEQIGGAALVAFAVVQHFDEQGDFDFAQHDAVQVIGGAAIQIAEVAADGGGNVFTQRCLFDGIAMWHGVFDPF